MDHIGAHRVVARLEGYGREVYLTRRSDGSRALVALFDIADDTALHLEQAAASCLSIGDPHLSHVSELFPHEGHRAVVFDDVGGISLAMAIEQLRDHDEPLSDGAVLEVGLGMCRGLAAAHMAHDEEGKVVPLVHSQLGADQVFISFTGTIKLLGMGLGPIFKLSATMASLPASARAHAAPEVKRGGPVTARANTFTAASILWSVLSRTDPPSDSLYPSLTKLRPELDVTLAATIDKALEPAVLRRTVTCRQLADVIAASGLADPKELMSSIEILRRAPEISNSVFPLESLPPTSGPHSDGDAPTGIFRAPTPPAAEDDVDALWDVPDVPAPKENKKNKKNKKNETTERHDTQVSALGGPAPEKAPVPPARKPMGTMQGLAPPKMTAVDKPTPKVRNPRRAEIKRIQRLKSKRDEVAKRETMRLATNVGASSPTDDLGAALKPPKVPVVGVSDPSPGPTPIRISDELDTGPDASPDSEPVTDPRPDLVPESEPETDPRPRVTRDPEPEVGLEPPKQPEIEEDSEEERGDVDLPPPSDDDEEADITTNRLPDALPNMPEVQVPRAAPPVIPIAPQQGTPLSAVSPRASPPVVPRVPRQPQRARRPAAGRPPRPAAGRPPRPAAGRPPEPGPKVRPKTASYPVWAMVVLTALIGAIALGLGLLFGNFAKPKVQASSQVTPGPAPSLPPQPATPPSTIPPAPAPAPAPTATSAVSAAATLDASSTSLEIDTSITGAHVYLDGNHVGPHKKRVVVPCGVHNIRLGDFPLTKWLSKGRTFHLKCGKAFELTLEAGYAGRRIER